MQHEARGRAEERRKIDQRIVGVGLQPVGGKWVVPHSKLQGGGVVGHVGLHSGGVRVAWSDRATSPSSDPTRLARTGVEADRTKGGCQRAAQPRTRAHGLTAARRSADPPHPPAGRPRHRLSLLCSRCARGEAGRCLG